MVWTTTGRPSPYETGRSTTPELCGQQEHADLEARLHTAADQAVEACHASTPKVWVQLCEPTATANVTAYQSQKLTASSSAATMATAHSQCPHLVVKRCT